MALGSRGRGLCFRSRRGTWRFRVARVVLCDIDRHFAWQAWHSGGALGSRGRLLCLRGRCGTWRHPPSWQGWHLRHASWQARHLATSTFTLRVRRGTWRHQASLCVAGMVLGNIDLHFASQAWYLRHWIGLRGTRVTWQAWHWAKSTFTLRGRRATCGTGLCLVAHTPHTQLCHSLTTLSHTIFVTHHLCHTPSFTQLCHTPSFTHILSHATLSHTHTTLSHTVFHTQLCHTHTHTAHTTLSPHNFVIHISSHTSFSLIAAPPPPLSFLPSPSRLNFCFCFWKELTCGVIRSFNCFCRGFSESLPQQPQSMVIIIFEARSVLCSNGRNAEPNLRMSATRHLLYQINFVVPCLDTLFMASCKPSIGATSQVSSAVSCG